MKERFEGKPGQAQSTLFKAWEQKIEQSGSKEIGAAELAAFQAVFTGMIEILHNRAGAGKAESVHQLMEDLSVSALAVDQAAVCRQSGMSLVRFVYLFKAMVNVCEEYIMDHDSSIEEKILYLTALHRVADRLEYAVIEDWHLSDGDRTHDQHGTEKMRSAIFQSVGEGILLVDEDMEVVKANHQASEIYGLSRENLIGADIQSLTDRPGAEKLKAFFNELIEGQRLSAEIAGIYVDGRMFPTRTTVTRIDLDGRRLWTIVVLDTTEEKALENRLRHEKIQTEEMNLTLKNVLKSIESDRRDFEKSISVKIKTSILPGLEKIRRESDAGVRNSYLGLLADQLVALTSGFDAGIDAEMLKLTRTEIEVCRLIQNGLSGKEISEAMNLAFETIQTHRKNIRKKLKLSGKKINLNAYLTNRICEADNKENNA
ncbi:MAG: PAS domain S-box protein [Deltaproteobacteria bacterium]|nr:PAS domain S-box protein [Deltaproteobacteria bacterium]